METKVLTVDVGGAITNVQEFKKHIEDLKGALLGLEKGTEEYNTVADELRSSQEKLTEVMDVARGKAEGVEGSYDNLVATMRELKKAWRATTDEAERADLGAQILDINNQLKELDASTGNFQRNVGDYANAFESAFKTVMGQIGQVNPELSRSAGLINQLIPVIKKSTSVATAGLSGIKKAIVSTGIGALVVAVGLLAANWDKVAAAIKRSTAAGKKELEQESLIANAAEDIKRIKEETSDASDYQVKLLRAQGAEEKDILEVQLAQHRTTLARLQAKRDELGVIFKEKQALVEQAVAEGRSEWRINKLAKARDASLTALNEANKALENQKKEITIIEASLDRIKNKQVEVNIRTTTSGSKDATDDYVEKRIAELRENNKSDLEKLYDAYSADRLKFLEKGYSESSEEMLLLYNNYITQVRAILKKSVEESNKELEDSSDKMFKDMVAATDLAIKMAQDDVKQRTVEVQLNYDFKEANEKVPWEFMEKLFGKEQTWNSSLEDSLKAREEELTELYKLQVRGFETEIDALTQLRGILTEGTDAYIENERKIVEANAKLRTADVEYQIKLLDLQDEREEKLHQRRIQRMNDLQDMFNSIGSLTSNLADAMEEQINTEVESGKISEATAKSRFESVKKMQIGAAIINTAAGVVSAIAAAQEAGPYLGPILAAINSAAVIAAGTAQISQIKRQQFGSSSNDSTSTPNLSRVSSVQQAPVVVANPTGNNELSQLTNAVMARPSVVKVSDIEDTQRIQNATITESEF